MSPPDPSSSAAPRGGGSGSEAVRIHASKLKYFLMALPCAYLAVLGAHGIQSGIGPQGLEYALVAGGAIAAVVLLLTGFSREPVLVIDAEGIYCRRPAYGLIPWRAIAGIAFGRGLFPRAVLIVAYDEAALAPEEAARLKRQRPSVLMNPRLAAYRGPLDGHPTVQIPLVMLAVRPRRLKDLLQREIRYHAEPQ